MVFLCPIKTGARFKSYLSRFVLSDDYDYDYESVCQMCFLVQALKENVNKLNNAEKRILG